MENIIETISKALPVEAAILRAIMPCEKVPMNPERRAQPRFVVNFPVQLRVIEEEQIFDGVALNVSRNALEVDCDTRAWKSLQSQSRYPYSCEIEFRLPGLNEEARLACQLLRFRRLSQHRYRIVLGFRDAMPVPLKDLSLSANDPGLQSH